MLGLGAFCYDLVEAIPVIVNQDGLADTLIRQYISLARSLV